MLPSPSFLSLRHTALRPACTSITSLRWALRIHNQPHGASAAASRYVSGTAKHAKNLPRPARKISTPQDDRADTSRSRLADAIKHQRQLQAASRMELPPTKEYVEDSDVTKEHAEMEKEASINGKLPKDSQTSVPTTGGKQPLPAASPVRTLPSSLPVNNSMSVLEFLYRHEPVLYKAPSHRAFAILTVFLIGSGLYAGFTCMWTASALQDISIFVPIAYYFTGAVLLIAVGAFIWAPSQIVQTIKVIKDETGKAALEVLVKPYLYFPVIPRRYVISGDPLVRSESISLVSFKYQDRVEAQQLIDAEIAKRGIGRRILRSIGRFFQNTLETILVAIFADGLVRIYHGGRRIGRLDARGWLSQGGHTLDRVTKQKEWYKSGSGRSGP